MSDLSRHLIGLLTAPLTVSLLIAAVATILRRRPKVMRVLLVVAGAVAYVGSMPIVGDALLGPLERCYPPLRQGVPLPAVGYVAVLGSGYTPHDGVPVTAALDGDGLTRVVEAVRLARELQGSRVIVSGGAPPGMFPPAHGYAELARDLGIEEQRLVMLDTPLNTRAEANLIASLVGKSPFILVTSAYHMPRAVRELQYAGASPIAAPTGQLVRDHSVGDVRRWLPTSSGLFKVERALHEYAGLVALAARPG